MDTAVCMIVAVGLIALGLRAWFALGRELDVMAAEDEAAMLARRAARQRMYATQAALGLTPEEWAEFDEWRNQLEVRS